MNRSLVPLLALGFLTLSACGTAAPAPVVQSVPTGATEGPITAEDLRLRAGILAADSMRGREAGTPGAGSAARYLETELARLQLTPAGDGNTYLQRVPLERTRHVATVTATVEGRQIPLGLDEIVPVSGLAGLPPTEATAGGGPLVFAGHIIDPSVDVNELSPDQLSGAVVIVRLGIPVGVNPMTAGPRAPIAALFDPATSTAAAVLLVAEETDASLWAYVTEIARKGHLALASPPGAGPFAPPFFLISKETAEQLIGGSLETAREPKTGLGSVEYTLREEREVVDAWNVAAIVPGRDPRLRGQYVTLGAHYDHVGVGEPVNGDSIYNGADDNASGSSTLLEVAEALATLPEERRPGRSTLFVWNTAEEAGLLGSEHFTDHPTVPRDSIVAHINMDMVGRNHPDSLFVVGPSRLSTELASMVEEVNAGLPRSFNLDYSYDPPGHPEMIYCRSDHYNYARYGIPIVFFTSGLHPDYHAPSDEASKLDYDKMAHVAEYTLALVSEIGDRPERPAVDKPVPPLGTPCS